ncbi:MAG: hypothetical protein HQ580_09870, partial [Planctomycetes bacterium]|nr:hypothetical protein [Planctomycetota bacterium]
MSLQVNMILDSELRSGSSVRQKFVVQMLAAVVPILFLFVMIPLVFGSRAAKKNRLLVELERKQIRPNYIMVLNLRKELHNYQAFLRDMEGWRDSRTVWHQALRSLQEIVPVNIQLTRLVVAEKVEVVDGVPARITSMYIKGKVVGEKSEKDVEYLHQALKESQPFKSLMERVEVKRFAASKNAEESHVRVV